MAATAWRHGEKYSSRLDYVKRGAGQRAGSPAEPIKGRQKSREAPEPCDASAVVATVTGVG